jgi:hypothetical protein
VAAAPAYRIEGARELRKQLRAASGDLSDLKAAHAEAGRIVEPVAKGRVPVRSGALRASVRSSGTATTAVIRAGYARVPYARPIHWGWPARNIRRNAFAWDAIKETQPRWMLAYKRAVDGILSRVRGKAAS